MDKSPKKPTDLGESTRADAAKMDWQNQAVAQIETAIRDVRQRLDAVQALAHEEQMKSVGRDTNDPAFSPLAKALLDRQESLKSTLQALTRQLARARRDFPPSD